MIASLDFVESQSSRDVALPIHPAVTLEDWVGQVHGAMLDQALSHEKLDELLDQIIGDSAALEFFTELCMNENMIFRYFDEFGFPEPELAEAVASPIW